MGGGGAFSLTPSSVQFLPLGCTLTVSTVRHPNFKLYITCQYNTRKDSWEGGGGRGVTHCEGTAFLLYV